MCDAAARGGRTEAGEEAGDAELLRAYSADGRERAVEDVVDAVVAAGLLDGGDVGGLLDDADECAGRGWGWRSRRRDRRR